MGVIDWFKRGVGEMMVARPDDAKPQVVWKHPDPTIPMKSQLTVESDDAGDAVLHLTIGRLIPKGSDCGEIAPERPAGHDDPLSITAIPTSAITSEADGAGYVLDRRQPVLLQLRWKRPPLR